jgi:hypothetical protein
MPVTRVNPALIDDIIRRVRATPLDDHKVPYLWSPEELAEFIADGQEDMARLAWLIEDDSTADICEIALTTTDISYALDSSVVYIWRAKAHSTNSLWGDVVLDKTQTQKMDQNRQWETNKGVPAAFMTDKSPGFITLDCAPTDVGTLYLKVSRLPLTRPMCGAGDTLELDAKHVPVIMNYIAYRAFDKPDADTRNDQLSEKFKKRYEDGRDAARLELIRQHAGNTNIRARRSML